MPIFADPDAALRAAFPCGNLVGCLVRAARRSPSGVALVLVFAAQPAAGAFAAAVAAQLGVAISVRRIRRAHGAPAFGVVLPVAGSIPFGTASRTALAKCPARFTTAWAIPDAAALRPVGDAVARALL